MRRWTPRFKLARFHHLASESPFVGGIGGLPGIGRGGSLSRSDPRAGERIQFLQSQDARVRVHEEEHLNTAGSFALGGIHLDFLSGPDGREYAVGGHVQLDTSEISGDPRATAQKARVIREAALKPGDPSDQDRRVAAEASVMESQAQINLANQLEKSRKTLGLQPMPLDPISGLAPPLFSSTV